MVGEKRYRARVGASMNFLDDRQIRTNRQTAKDRLGMQRCRSVLAGRRSGSSTERYPESSMDMDMRRRHATERRQTHLHKNVVDG